ncbi:MAG: hypothetical protein ABI718_09760 [Acidobacteriota bacterium]
MPGAFFIGAALLVLAGASCFEDPVAESVEVKILPEDLVQITTTVTITDQSPEGVASRLAQLRQEIQSQHDPWSRRYAGLEAATESLEWQKRLGVLHGMRRSAVVAFDDLGRFFSDTAITVGFIHGDGWDELSLYAGDSIRATREQQQSVSVALDHWSRSASGYLSALDAIYRYIDDNPKRSAAMLGRLFSGVLDEDELKGLPELNADEKAMLEQSDRFTSELTEMFEVAAADSYSLNELTELVYDPFPAAVSVVLPGAVLESSGFIREKNGALKIPRTSLWTAMQSLQGQWLSPDPVTLQVSRARDGSEEKMTLKSILDTPRRSRTDISAQEIRRSLEGKLHVPDHFRVRWVHTIEK